MSDDLERASSNVMEGADPSVAPRAQADAGWPNPSAFGGRVLPLDLAGLDERALVRPGDGGALYPLGDGPAGFHPERDPLVLVHGIQGAPHDLQAAVERLRGGRFQLFAVCYDSYHRRTSANGDDLAGQLRLLQRALGGGRDLTLVAHSLGGIVVRQALDRLATDDDHPLARLGRVRFIAADTPWHGFPGPSDQGGDAILMSLARLLLPEGLDDMRARSAMFAGDPASTDPVARAGLLQVDLPDNVEITLAFAAQGDDILNYTRGCLAVLPDLLVSHFCDDLPVRGEPRVMNFWRALLSSSQYDAFADEMRDLGDARKLDRPTALAVLQRHFPLFPGDHMGILAEHPGSRSFLDFLDTQLGPAR
jgi:hypothetical protein